MDDFMGDWRVASCRHVSVMLFSPFFTQIITTDPNIHCKYCQKKEPTVKSGKNQYLLQHISELYIVLEASKLPTTHPLTPTKIHPRKNVFLWGFSLNCFSRWCLEKFPRICIIPRLHKSIFVLQSREGGGGGCFHNKHA